MKRLFFFLAALLTCLAGAWAQGPNDLNLGSQLAESSSTGAYSFSWWGAAGNTYLMETSDDLINWSYIPVVESGTGGGISWGLVTSATSLFMKLEYITVPASDLSGTLNGTLDPSGNGLPEDWELFNFGYLGVNPNADPNGQGFTVYQDYEYGMNPNANQLVDASPCVGEYPFHQTSGTIAPDLSSLQNNGLLTGSAGWQASAGYDGEGEITLDGTTASVVISDTGNQVVPVGGGPFSFAFWFLPNAGLTGTTTLVSAGVSGSTGFQCGVDWTVSPPNLVFSTSGSSAVNLTAAISPTGWTQTAVTFDGTDAAIYVNGLQVATGTGTLISDTSSITLGQGYGNGQDFAGAMEDLTLYEAVLTPLDVTALYNISTTTTDLDSSGLPNWWKYEYFGTLNVNPSASVAWSSSTTVLQAYQNGWNPVDYYNGQPPVLTQVSGNFQQTDLGDFASSPLVVNVTNASGTPLANAPVTFQVDDGWADGYPNGGFVQASSTGVSGTSITVFTDVNGNAQIYFQLPDTNAHDVTNIFGAFAMAGPDNAAFTDDYLVFGYIDSGYTYPSPFVPSNVRGVINADGSETITWTNNDSSDVFIYYFSDNTWSTLDVLNPGTTTYTASASDVGSIEVGNVYSPGGATGTAGGGDPGTRPTVTTTGQGYAVVDLSGPVTNGVSMVALNDNNNVAFAYEPDGETCVVDSWSAGTATNIQTITGTTATYESATNGEVTRTIEINPRCLTPTGTVYGAANIEYEYLFPNAPDPTPLFGPNISFSSSSGNITYLGLTSTQIQDPIAAGIFYYNGQIMPYNFNNVVVANNNSYAGWGALGVPGNVNTEFGFASINNSLTYFLDPSGTGTVGSWAPSGNIVQGPGNDFSPMSMNSYGGMVYNNLSASHVPSYGLWYGTAITSLQFYPVSINDGGEIVGNTIDSSGNEAGYGVIWEPSTQTATPLTSLSGSTTVVKTLAAIGPTYPFLISNARTADGSREILFADVNSNVYVLTLDASMNATSVSSIQIPSRETITSYKCINNGGVIAALGQPNASDNTTHAYLLIPAAIVPDYNHDGKIDGYDEGQQSAANPYCFWIDDSDPQGDDIPGSSTPNYATYSINGLGDLDNWFPVSLNIQQLLTFFPPGTYTYALQQADNAIKFAYTTLTPNVSGTYLRSLTVADNILSYTFDQPPNTGVFSLDPLSGGGKLSTAFLTNISQYNEGVLLCEGAENTSNPLELVVLDSNGNQVASVQMPLSLSGIENMYRQKNLINDQGGAAGVPTTLSAPPNYPDSLCNSQNFVFVHGYNVNPTQARGWNAAFFKRMYWSGSRAKFYGVTWLGAAGQQNLLGNLFTPDYQLNVRNAFNEAPKLANFINGLSGTVTVAAHSLGNMVVSSAIQDWNAQINNYYMIDAAVAVEAYQGSAPQESNMINSNWSAYPTDTWATEWHLDPALPANDGRANLTWRGRLGQVPSAVNLYNFYSGSEDVLRMQVGDPTVLSVLQTAATGGLYAWALQEKLKGNRIALTIPNVEAFVGSTYGGWGFDLNFTNPVTGLPGPLTSTQAAALSSQALLTTPIFDPGYAPANYFSPPPANNSPVNNPNAPSWIQNLTNPGQASATAMAHGNQLLAEMFPALTLAIGGEGGGGGNVSDFVLGDFDMPDLFVTAPNNWPNGSSTYNGDLIWKHSDIKDIDYLDVYGVFNEFVSLENLNQ